MTRGGCGGGSYTTGIGGTRSVRCSGAPGPDAVFVTHVRRVIGGHIKHAVLAGYGVRPRARTWSRLRHTGCGGDHRERSESYDGCRRNPECFHLLTFREPHWLASSDRWSQDTALSCALRMESLRVARCAIRHVYRWQRPTRSPAA